MMKAEKVDTAVMVTDIARLAFAMYAITFEASPLGDTPTRTRPAAISGGKPHVCARMNPISGMIVN